MFETPDQYVMETYHLYIKNHIYSFPNNIKTMDKCVCVCMEEPKFLGRMHPDILCKNRSNFKVSDVDLQWNKLDRLEYPHHVLSPPVLHQSQCFFPSESLDFLSGTLPWNMTIERSPIGLGKS